MRVSKGRTPDGAFACFLLDSQTLCQLLLPSLLSPSKEVVVNAWPDSVCTELGHPIIVFLLVCNYCVKPSDLTMTAHREQYHNPVKGQYHVPSVFVGRRPACPLLTDLKMINISTLLFQGVDMNSALMKPVITY